MPGLEMAIKLIPADNVEAVSDIKKEVDILKTCRHPSIGWLPLHFTSLHSSSLQSLSHTLVVWQSVFGGCGGQTAQTVFGF
jgi:hypothetical protein